MYKLVVVICEILRYNLSFVLITVLKSILAGGKILRTENSAAAAIHGQRYG